MLLTNVTGSSSTRAMSVRVQHFSTVLPKPLIGHHAFRCLDAITKNDQRR